MTYNEITLNQWSKIDEIYKQKYEDDILMTSDLISVVFNIDDPLSLSPGEFQKRVDELKFLNEEIPDKKLLSKYTINGTAYIFKGNIFEMNMSQLMDWRTYSTKTPVDYAECLSVFLIPEGYKYNTDYDMEKAIHDIGCIPLPDALKLFRFFAAALEMYTDILTDYLCKMTETAPTQKQKEIQEQIQELRTLLKNMTFFH